MKRDMSSVVSGLLFFAIFIYPFAALASKIWVIAILKRQGIKTRARIIEGMMVSGDNDLQQSFHGTYSFEAAKSETDAEMSTFTKKFTGGDGGKEIDIRYLARNPAVSTTEQDVSGYIWIMVLVFGLIFGAFAIGGLISALIGFFTNTEL